MVCSFVDILKYVLLGKGCVDGWMDVLTANVHLHIP